MKIIATIAVGAQNDKATRVYKNLGFEEGSLLLEQHFFNPSQFGRE